MKLIKVDWEDTFADVGWSDDKLTTVKVASVGWLIRKDKDKMVLSSMNSHQKLSGQLFPIDFSPSRLYFLP